MLSGGQSPGPETPKMSPLIEPLSWMLGTWLSEPPGHGVYPSLQPFHYLEEVHISHVGQPMLNFSFNAFHPDTKKPMHRECGFIRLKPDSNKVAFVSAQNTGIVEMEEGEVNGQELCITSHSIARMSLAAEPPVEQVKPPRGLPVPEPAREWGTTEGSLVTSRRSPSYQWANGPPCAVCLH
uniref:THAP domain containing 4 n=1 Tax=Monodelphis domestica TaxID=13616 RepID=A0A5F8GV21_MONDO